MLERDHTEAHLWPLQGHRFHSVSLHTSSSADTIGKEKVRSTKTLICRAVCLFTPKHAIDLQFSQRGAESKSVSCHCVMDSIWRVLGFTTKRVRKALQLWEQVGDRGTIAELLWAGSTQDYDLAGKGKDTQTDRIKNTEIIRQLCTKRLWHLSHLSSISLVFNPLKRLPAMNSRRLANAPALSESVSVSGSLYRPAVQLCAPEGPLEKQHTPPSPSHQAGVGWMMNWDPTKAAIQPG